MSYVFTPLFLFFLILPHQKNEFEHCYQQVFFADKKLGGGGGNISGIRQGDTLSAASRSWALGVAIFSFWMVLQPG